MTGKCPFSLRESEPGRARAFEFQLGSHTGSFVNQGAGRCRWSADLGGRGGALAGALHQSGGFGRERYVRPRLSGRDAARRARRRGAVLRAHFRPCRLVQACCALRKARPNGTFLLRIYPGARIWLQPGQVLTGNQRASPKMYCTLQEVLLGRASRQTSLDPASGGA